MAQEVNCYGIHWAPGKIAFLHQQRGAMNAIGLKAMTPFVVRISRRWICNHMISLAAANPARQHFVNFENLIHHNSLVRFMLPLPKEADNDTTNGVGVVSVNRVEDYLLPIAMLLKMSNPVKLPIFWLNMVSPRSILEELALTNVQPIVVVVDNPKHTAALQDIMRAAAHEPRRLLVLVNSNIPIKATLDGEDLYSKDEVDLTGLPWESLGATVVRAYMRNEWTGSWFTREPIPANEAKKDYNEPATSPAPGLPSS